MLHEHVYVYISIFIMLIYNSYEKVLHTLQYSRTGTFSDEYTYDTIFWWVLPLCCEVQSANSKSHRYGVRNGERIKQRSLNTSDELIFPLIR